MLAFADRFPFGIVRKPRAHLGQYPVALAERFFVRMGAMRDTMDALGLPYRIFGFDSDISEVILYAKAVDAWMKSGGRAQIAAHLNMVAAA